MRKPCAILALASMLFATPLLSADDHVVAPGTADSRLSGAAAERDRNIASLDALLKAPSAERAAAVGGLDVGRARQALSGLSDGELSDLAQRAAALTANPVAGHYDEATDALVLVMVFAAAALIILEAADHY